MSLTNKLMKIAGFGGVFVVGNALLMRWMIQSRLRESPYYKQAAEHVMKHRTLVDYLGEPLAFGNADLGDSSINFSTDKEARFSVPLKGSKQEGMMHFSAIKNPDFINVNPTTSNSNNKTNKEGIVKDKVWIINRLEITVKARPDEKLILVGSKEEAN